MKSPKPEFTAEMIANSAMDAWRAALEVSDEVPEGFKTSEELQKAFRIGKTAMAIKLKALHKAGRVEIKKFRIKAGERRMPVAHYRLK